MVLFDSIAPEIPLYAMIIIAGILVCIISVFIGYFYKSISKRDIIGLNLSKYNHIEHSGYRKLNAIILHILENIILEPILILIWFIALSIVILIISGGLDLEIVLLISAAVVIATRILAYFNPEESQNLSKLFPFIALSALLLNFGTSGIDQIAKNLYEVPQLLDNLWVFLVTIFIVEIILRLFYIIYEFWRSEDESAEEDAQDEYIDKIQKESLDKIKSSK